MYFQYLDKLKNNEGTRGVPKCNNFKNVLFLKNFKSYKNFLDNMKSSPVLRKPEFFISYSAEILFKNSHMGHPLLQ